MTSYLKDNQVTQAEATALLKYEYEAEIAKYGRLLSHRTLREVKAVALLGFNIKEGKFRFSGLFEELEKPKVNGKKVRSLWMQYCHYRDTKGRWRTSRGLRDRRVLELDLFFGRMDRVLKAGRRFERDLSLAHKGG
jgi:GH24 family phage-related lysozyme (muramidase)